MGGSLSSGGSPASGGSASSTGGQSGSTGGQPGCVPSDEICDGLDNNCSGSASDEVCPASCVGRAFANKGYMFCGLDSTQAIAAAACSTSSSRALVEINSDAENAFVVEVATELSWAGPWLGATDKGSEGEWRWPSTTKFWTGNQDGNAVGNRFSAWAPGNPNDGEDGQDCAVLCTQTNNLSCSSVGVWNDVACEVARIGFVCETP